MENDIIIKNKVVFMKEKLNFYKIFWLFVISSVIGWFIEVIFTFVTQGIFINHSALVVGPFNAAYGICACALTLLLYRFKDYSFFKLYIIGFLGGTILEYIMSWGMELVLGFSAWDYTGLFLNINGRVCLIMSILWGFLGVAWIKFIYPIVEEIINALIKKFGKKLVYIILVFLILDLGLTGCAILRARECSKGVAPANSFEKFLDNTFNKDYLTNMFNNSWSE